MSMPPARSQARMLRRAARAMYALAKRRLFTRQNHIVVTFIHRQPAFTFKRHMLGTRIIYAIVSEAEAEKASAGDVKIEYAAER